MTNSTAALCRLYGLAGFIESACGAWVHYHVMFRHTLTDGTNRVIDIPKDGRAMFICGELTLGGVGDKDAQEGIRFSYHLSRHTLMNHAYLHYLVNETSRNW